MVRNREEIEELIALYLSGEASPEQAMDLDSWRSLNIENQTLFEVYEKTYTATHNLESFKAPNVDAEWKKVKSNIGTETKIVPLFKNRKFYMSIAAVGLIAFVIGSLWNFNPGQPSNPSANANHTDTTGLDKETVLYASANVESFILKDQSIVELTSGSKLTLAKDFDKNGRNVELKGSGTFTVVHDESNPFVLQVEGLEVFDIGTVFDVKTKGDTVSVIVSEGEVELRLNGKVLALEQGDSAYYLISEQLMERYKNPKTRLDKVFKFEGATLSQVTSDIGAFFEREIVIMDDAVKDCQFTVTFKDETLAQILDIIQLTFDIEIVHNNKIIEIYGEDCN